MSGCGGEGVAIVLPLRVDAPVSGILLILKRAGTAENGHATTEDSNATQAPLQFTTFALVTKGRGAEGVSIALP